MSCLLRQPYHHILADASRYDNSMGASFETSSPCPHKVWLTTSRRKGKRCSACLLLPQLVYPQISFWGQDIARGGRSLWTRREARTVIKPRWSPTACSPLVWSALQKLGRASTQGDCCSLCMTPDYSLQPEIGRCVATRFKLEALQLLSVISE